MSFANLMPERGEGRLFSLNNVVVEDESRVNALGKSCIFGTQKEIPDTSN